MTGDAQLKPYTSWVDLVQNLKHPESLINFIAAYGTHSALTAADVDTMAEMRAVAAALVLGGSATINAGMSAAERIFTPMQRPPRLPQQHRRLRQPAPNGVTTTGLDDIDFWIGGLAEEQMPFGGLLGSTFNFVFETQLENLQNGDRFYYLSRTAGLNFGTELENNSFAQLVHAEHRRDASSGATSSRRRPSPWRSIRRKQFTGLGADGRADPTGGITIRRRRRSRRWSSATIPTRSGPIPTICTTPATDHVVLGGTAGNDILIAGASDDDTVYGDGGNDRLEGGFGNDKLFGGDGDDIITGHGRQRHHPGRRRQRRHLRRPLAVCRWLGNIILGGDGKDFIVTREDISTIFGGAGDDFILRRQDRTCRKPATKATTGSRLGTQDGAPGDNFNPFLADDVPGNDIFVGGGGFDEMIGEGGDDIFVGSDAQDKMDGMSGFDWVTYKDDTYRRHRSTWTLARHCNRAAGRGLARVDPRPLRRSGRPVGLASSPTILRGDDADAERHRHIHRADQRAGRRGHRARRGLQAAARHALLGAGACHRVRHRQHHPWRRRQRHHRGPRRRRPDRRRQVAQRAHQRACEHRRHGPGDRQLRQHGADDPADAERDLQSRPARRGARNHDGTANAGGFDTAVYRGTPGELHDLRQQQRHADQLRRRRRHRDRHQRHAARRHRPPHPYRAAAVRRSGR